VSSNPAEELVEVDGAITLPKAATSTHSDGEG
jgi:hypothetical protein